MTRRIWSPILVACLAAACASEPDVGDVPVGDEETGKADVASTPTLSFSGSAGGRVEQSGPLVAGHRARIRWSLDRIRDCRGETGGSQAWGATAYVRAGGRTETFAVSELQGGQTRPVDALFTVPDAAELEVWFSVNNRWGCIAYDSANGANYRFSVQPAATASLRFGADWSEKLTGSLGDGGTLSIDYALARMAKCPASSPWMVTRVDGARATARQLYPTGNDAARATTVLSLPAGANTLEVWFERRSRYGCTEVDSNFGDNYFFQVR